MTDEIPTDAETAAAGPDAEMSAAKPPAMNAADTSFDLSLRLLTALVTFALIGSVGLLVYRWIEQNRISANGNPVPASASQPAPVSKAPDQGPMHRDEVLMDPGRVFKCEEQGRVTFSDQACTGGAPAARTPPPAPAGH